MWILADFIKNIGTVGTIAAENCFFSTVPVVLNNSMARVSQCINPYTNMIKIRWSVLD
jgi:hypothetical protein